MDRGGPNCCVIGQSVETVAEKGEIKVGEESRKAKDFRCEPGDAME